MKFFSRKKKPEPKKKPMTEEQFQELLKLGQMLGMVKLNKKGEVISVNANKLIGIGLMMIGANFFNQQRKRR